MSVTAAANSATRAPAAAPAARQQDGAVKLSGVGLERRGHRLVTDLTLRVEPGETLAVMGPSGAGKTTLVRTIAGLASPTQGSVARPDGRVAIIFQDPRLLPWRTAVANVALVMPKQRRATAHRWLERVGLGEAANVFPSALSGGMRQRVAIARALASEPAVLIADEPFSHLDADTAVRLRDLLTAALADAGQPAIWVTHRRSEAAAIAERALVLDGPPDGSWRLVNLTPTQHQPEDHTP